MTAKNSENLRVVFDCNIYLQAAVRDTGPAFACLELAEANAFTLLASNAVFAEIEEVLSRPSIRKKFSALTDERVRVLMNHLAHLSEFVSEVPVSFSFARDLKDEPYLNLAIVAGAHYIISRDKDILSLRDGMNQDSREFRDKYPEIKLLDPVEFLRVIRA